MSELFYKTNKPQPIVQNQTKKVHWILIILTEVTQLTVVVFWRKMHHNRILLISISLMNIIIWACNVNQWTKYNTFTDLYNVNAESSEQVVRPGTFTQSKNVKS